ncbi:hypothetical protein HCY64_10390 [Acinetobacter radioresistens]|uniref:hypothetical protein n=1 Tax=Acinetobacter radioresistens TaxID=40216 RepID=UPI00200615FF|nr:hypothetical protein [Acinetobacter radioresistens]MCK4096449.1 hypothetical protein [Acinetobacter radioresistens]MCU4622229.1 hypothetical protein [Acinetobacter radioresistens]
MQQYLDSIRLSLATKNYFGAIAMALTLPDICASIEAENNETSREKYCAWFDSYLSQEYKIPADDWSEEKVLFSAKECYAARCSFLHQGTNITSHQKVLKGVEKAAPSVSFMKDTIISKVSRNDHEVTLDVDSFCQNMINAVNKWIEDNKNNEIICDKIAKLPNVYVGTGSLPFVYTIGPR